MSFTRSTTNAIPRSPMPRAPRSIPSKQRVGFAKTVDLALDGLSLASIYFLAAIGLAITFGVMGVINMAHGEFIMMGAYTGYVVQLFIPDYTLSIIVALPLAFADHLWGRRRDGAAGDPPSLSPPAGNAAGDLWHLDRAAAIGQEHLRHPGAPADLARLAGRGVGDLGRDPDQLYPHRDLRAGAAVPRR